MKIEIGASVVVSMAPPGETRWGFWNFPYLFRMPAGRRWGNRRTLVEPDPKNNCAATCGYSSMEPLDAGRFLVAHTIFRHIDAEGRPRKAIVVREVRVDL